MTWADRRDGYTSCSAQLGALGDSELRALVDRATPNTQGIGGAGAVLDIDGATVFVKRIALTAVEQRSANVGSTANLFGLPPYYHYGLGSAGFGAWRELAAHRMTTNWVLTRRYQGFPLLYHWRVLPGAPPRDAAYAEFGGLDEAVRFWNGSNAIRARLEAIRDATASIVLFLEYIPRTLTQWLNEQDLSVHARVGELLGTGIEFMRDRSFLHCDAHFANILTDGVDLYFADFGLALSADFELDHAEAEFLALHRNYDSAYTTNLLLAHFLAG